MTGLSDEIGREIILRHFPKADPAVVDRHSLWLSPPFVADLPPYKLLKDGDEIDARIEAFRRAINEAWTAYQAIPLHVRQGNGIDWVGFAKLAKAASGAALHGETPIARPPAIEIMQHNARKADRLSAQAMANDHPAKIALAEKCRDAWRDLSGKEPPLKPSGRRLPENGDPVFLYFVQDVIDGAGKPWKADKALAAWRTAETHLAG